MSESADAMRERLRDALDDNDRDQVEPKPEPPEEDQGEPWGRIGEVATRVGAALAAYQEHCSGAE